MNDKGKYLLLVLGCAAAIAGLAGLGYSLHKKQISFNQSYDRIVSQADDLTALLGQSDNTYDQTPDEQSSAPSAISSVPETDAIAETDAVPEAATVSAADAVSETNVVVKTNAVSKTNSVAGTNAGAETESETQPADASSRNRLIVVGDSRTVGMQRSAKSLSDPCIYIAASGEGYLWFKASGVKRLQRTLARYPGTPVVFNLGVNDLESINHYISIYKSLIQDNPQSDFWFLSVNPVTEDAIYVLDEEVDEFNKQLRSAFPDQYLDSYSRMKKEGFESVDGLHYSEETYLEIHDYLVDTILGEDVY